MRNGGTKGVQDLVAQKDHALYKSYFYHRYAPPTTKVHLLISWDSGCRAKSNMVVLFKVDVLIGTVGTTCLPIRASFSSLSIYLSKLAWFSLLFCTCFPEKFSGSFSPSTSRSLSFDLYMVSPSKMCIWLGTWQDCVVVGVDTKIPTIARCSRLVLLQLLLEDMLSVSVSKRKAGV